MEVIFINLLAFLKLRLFDKIVNESKESLVKHIQISVNESDVNMLKIIECFKKTGMSISEIKQFVHWLKEGDSSLEQRYDLFKNRKEIVLNEMKNLEKQLELIDHKLWYYKTAIEAGTEEIHKK